MDQLASDQSLARERDIATGGKPGAVQATILFFLFPPAGVYLLWKDRKLHEQFAILTALIGFFNVLSAGTLYFSYGAIVEFSREVGYEIPANWHWYALILLFFAVYQTLSCLVLVREAKKTGYLNTIRLSYLVGMLLIDYIVIPLVLGVVLVDFLKAYYQKVQSPFNETLTDPYNWE